LWVGTLTLAAVYLTNGMSVRMPMPYNATIVPVPTTAAAFT
jgi:hypothetical protein